MKHQAVIVNLPGSGGSEFEKGSGSFFIWLETTKKTNQSKVCGK